MNSNKPYIVPLTELERRMNNGSHGIFINSNFNTLGKDYVILFSTRNELQQHLLTLTHDEIVQAIKDLGPIVGPAFVLVLTMLDLYPDAENIRIRPEQFQEHYMNGLWHHVKAVAEQIE